MDMNLYFPLAKISTEKKPFPVAVSSHAIAFQTFRSALASRRLLDSEVIEAIADYIEGRPHIAGEISAIEFDENEISYIAYPFAVIEDISVPSIMVSRVNDGQHRHVRIHKDMESARRDNEFIERLIVENLRSS